jgi:DNA-binding IclR family transcriptional regulator
VWLAQLELDRVYYIARVDGDSPLKVHMPLLQLQPAHAVAAGRVMLAGQSQQRASATLQLHALRKMTPTTSTDVAHVLGEITRARKQGWAETEGEHIDGASDIAVPVFGINNLVLAAVSIGAPSHVFGPERRQQVLPELFKAAGEITRRLVAGAKREPADRDD